ncbi:MAG: TonB-dependent receptor [Acidobacteria bacterium]|nr:TonB-dependent receptor [Acidobacteriota bacterium]
MKDSTGAIIPGATVEIFNETTGVSERRMSTGPEGNYTATLLPPGSYRLEVTGSGFKRYQAVGVPVRINETTRHDTALELGAVQEAITVEAFSTLVNTESATTGQGVDSKTLAALPLPVPNFLFLLALSPGAAGEPADVRSANRGIVDINVNGQRTTNNSVSIEGINVNDFNLAHFDTVPLPNPAAIQEFKVATSLYDSSMGSKGGGAVTLVLRSGTKDWHGGVYWNHRNDALNANEWFRNQVGALRAKLLQNVFGGSASGPIPKLGGFWFANVHGVRARNGLDPNGASISPLIQRFPTASDGTTNAALLGSAFGLTPAQIDPVAVNILNLKSSIYGGNFAIPRAGDPGCQSPAGATASFRCTFSKVAPLADTQYTITHDRSFRDGRDRISGRWFYDNGDVAKPFGTAGGLSFPRADVQRNRFLSLSQTHLISPRQVNEFRFGFSRFNSSFAPTDLVNLKDVGATRPNEGAVPGIYFFSITGLFSFGTGVNDERGTISNQFQWGDTWSLTAGKHSFRAGFEALRYQLNRYNRFAARGSLTFGSTSGENNTFTPFQNFLQGRITAIQSAGGDPQRYFRASDFSAFFQDDWRLRARLTVNLGLRWEGMGFGYDKYLRASIYDATLAPQQNPFLFAEGVQAPGVKGTPGVGKCALRRCFDDNNFAPRAGFAWDVKGNQKTVVRGGYGIYYQRLSNQNLLQGSLAAPFFVQPLDNRPTPDAFQLRNPVPQPLPSGAVAPAFIPQNSRFAGLRRVSGTGPLDINDPGVAPIFVNETGEPCLNYGGTVTNCSINLAAFTSARPSPGAPYNQQWNLTIQRQLASGWAVEAGYVGAHYVGGIGIWAPNLASLASPSSPINVTDINGNRYSITANAPNNEELRHGVLGLSRKRGARFSENIGFATYHSAQFTVSRRLSKGLFFQAGYTRSKSIDNVSGSQSTDELNATRNGQGGANILNFQNNPRANRALGDFDRPNRLVVSYSYDLPVPKSGLLGTQIFQGWNLSGIVTYQNGLPHSIFDSSSGGAYGATGIGTGLLVCRPLSEQLSSLPGCTPGAPTTREQATLSGSWQSRLTNVINPNFFSAAPNVPNAAGAGVTGYGNVPRNAFRGPSQQNWDFSVGKKFTIKEKHSVMFRADFFNLFNHPVFQQPNSVTINSPSTFTQITTTVSPARLIQFGLRYEF